MRAQKETRPKIQKKKKICILDFFMIKIQKGNYMLSILYVFFIQQYQRLTSLEKESYV